MNKSTHLDLPLRANAVKGGKKTQRGSKSRAKGQKKKGSDRKRGYLGAERICRLTTVKEITAVSKNSQLLTQPILKYVE